MKKYSTNINQQIRDYLTTTLEITRTYGSKDEYKKRIDSIISELEKDNEQMYQTFLGTIFSDYYKMLYSKSTNKKTTDEEEGCLVFFASLKNISTLSQELKLLPELKVDMINGVLDFNSLSFFEKRKILITCKSKNTFLQQVNPSHFVDQLYYCQSYDPERFIAIYNKIIKNSVSRDSNAIKNMAIESLKSIFEELKQCDPANTRKIGYAMLRDYYIFKKFEATKSRSEKEDKALLRVIETSDIEDFKLLSPDYDSSDITNQIIKGFIEYNTERTEEYRNQSSNYLKDSIPKNMKTKLHYNKRRKTI